MFHVPLRWSFAFDGVVSKQHKERLADPAYLLSVLYQVADVAGMRILSTAASSIQEDLSRIGEEPFLDEGGCSVQALISTSHMALHGWPNRLFFMFDLVSCREFDHNKVHTAVIERLPAVKACHHAAHVPAPLPCAYYFTALERVFTIQDKAAQQGYSSQR